MYNGKVYTPRTTTTGNYNGYGFDHNIRILRYSDVLLMYAEALVNGASVTLTKRMSADMAVNMVRERAGLENLSGVTLEQIWMNAVPSLAMEEDRFFDLIRTGQAKEAMAKVGKTFVEGKHEVYPIPAAQILNPKLTQNNGYN